MSAFLITAIIHLLILFYFSFLGVARRLPKRLIYIKLLKFIYDIRTLKERERENNDMELINPLRNVCVYVTVDL